MYDKHRRIEAEAEAEALASTNIEEFEAMAVHHISKCNIKQQHVLDESLHPCYLTPVDVSFLSINYIQHGLVFTKPPQNITIQTILDQLKESLSSTLTHYYPLTGKLVTLKNLELDPKHSYCVLLDYKDGPGAKFIHAIASKTTISDILSPIDVPVALVESLFALGDDHVNHDGHMLPLLAVQVTELVDGIFIGCSFNHVVGDGSSFWHFFNTWSQISRSNLQTQDIRHISRPPVTKRWFINDHERITNLPYSHPDEFIERYIPDSYRLRVFHFTTQSIALLKAKANADLGTYDKISSFQAVAALVWRSITRARRLMNSQTTTCVIPVDIRSRLDPQLSGDYFGNYVSSVFPTITVGELLNSDLGSCALMLHNEIAGHTNVKIRSGLKALTKSPFVFKVGGFDNTFVGFGMSPRYKVYSNDFGWGVPVAARSGFGLKSDGKVTWLPGQEGGGSMDLEICLLPESMNALELDKDFMNAVTLTPKI